MRSKPFNIAFLREITDQYDNEEVSYSKFVELLNDVAIRWRDSEEVKFYPIHISSPKYKKLLTIMSRPEYKIWYKDKEITEEQLIEILSK